MSRAISHVCCPACRVRFPPRSGAERLTCPSCGGPVTSLAALEALGYSLWAPANPLWSPANLVALAHAVAGVSGVTPPAPR